MTQTPRSPPSSGSFSLIAAAARRSTLKVPIRLTLTTLEKNSRLWGPPLCATRSAQPIPAQQTEMRRPPPCEAARSTAADTASASVTSASTKLALTQLGRQRLALLGVEVGDHRPWRRPRPAPARSPRRAPRPRRQPALLSSTRSRIGASPASTDPAEDANFPPRGKSPMSLVHTRQSDLARVFASPPR